MNEIKVDEVRDYWEDESCGELYAVGENIEEQYVNHKNKRYELEPYIYDFAEFDSFAGQEVLEIGVGMGADHLSIAERGPKMLVGIDLTEKALDHTKKRFDYLGMDSDLKVMNAESLSFKENSFDQVYSWGVIHHSPDTPKCFKEIYRVLKKGGEAKLMIYYKYSPTGFMLWLRYALLKLKPFTSMAEVYSNHLESPGTKAYTKKEVSVLTSDFRYCDMQVVLGFSDLLLGEAGHKHEGPLLSLARAIFPRSLIRIVSNVIPIGLYLLIKLRK